MIDVFVRVADYNLLTPWGRLRQAFWVATQNRWKMEGVKLIAFEPRIITRDRKWAEYTAKTDPYIYTDDDVVIVGKNWIDRGLAAMLAHPEYAVCSSLSLVEGENQAVPPPGAGLIYPMHWVGAPMWIRKGILTDLPGMTLNNECEQIHNYVLAKGFQEGLITGLRHLHLGHGFSSTPGLDFGY